MAILKLGCLFFSFLFQASFYTLIYLSDGGEDSEEEVIICSSSIDKEDNKDKHKNDDNKEKHKNVDNDNNNEDMFVQKTETKKDEDALNLSTVTLDDNTKIEIEKGDDSTDLPSLEGNACCCVVEQLLKTLFSADLF